MKTKLLVLAGFVLAIAGCSSTSTESSLADCEAMDAGAAQNECYWELAMSSADVTVCDWLPLENPDNPEHNGTTCRDELNK
ncbi:MAG: hypothetical protein ABIH78_00010 [Candidatus Peregrinibacteria bacterium]